MCGQTCGCETCVAQKDFELLRLDKLTWSRSDWLRISQELVDEYGTERMIEFYEAKQGE